MEKHLFVSCFIMFLLSISVLVTLFIRRVRDVAGGVTDPKYFKTYDLQTSIPPQTKQLVRNYVNLFESPMLFYAVIGLVLAMNLIHPHLIYLAYAYVGLRVCHTIVHVTNNKLYPRMLLFLLSMLVLSGLWVRTLLLVFAEYQG